MIGHVVLDRNTIGGIEHPPKPGGAAFYATSVFARLGLRTAVVTRVAPADEDLLLGELRALGVHVINLGTARSTVFRNIDAPSGERVREQRVDQAAAPIEAADLPDLAARIWYLGPLARDDLDCAIAGIGRERGGRVAIDVQGLVRRVEDGRVVPEQPSAPPGLGAIDVLKADDAEILTFTGTTTLDSAARAAVAAGAREVVITKANRGSILFDGRRRIEVPAYRPRPELDPTGCGDTYLAAYLTRRLETDDLAACGCFAAAAAAIKMQDNGPFRSDQAAILAHLAAGETWSHQK